MTSRLVAVSGGESSSSKTRSLAAAAIDLHGSGDLIDLSALPAEGLLGRTEDQAVAAAVELAGATDILLVATPVYRATYTGAVKAFFDRFPMRGLSSTAVILAATALAPEHFLSLDTGLRPLIASLEGWSVPTAVYATSDDFVDGRPADHVLALLKAALDEAGRLTR